MQTVSAYIICFNEAAKIKAAVESVLWADEIVVVEFQQHRRHGRDCREPWGTSRAGAVPRLWRFAQPSH